jgi:phage-related minor tail protein
VSGPNVISIEITTTDKAGLKQLTRTAQQVGKDIETGLGKGLDAAERKATQAGDKMAASLKSSGTKIDKSFDLAARQVGRYLYQIEREAWSSGNGMDEAFSEASRSIRGDLNKIREDAGKTGHGLESDLGNALKKVQQQADSLHKSIKPPDQPKKSEGSGILDDLLGDFGSVKGGALALGGAAAGFIWTGLQAEWKEDAIGGLLAAQTGAAEAQSERLGNLAGSVFSDNFGSSMDDVAEAMHAVFEQKLVNPDSADADITAITEKVMTLGQVTGESFDDISRDAEQMVKTGIAGSVSDAMDLIGMASEHGLNAAHDLFDTIEEYSTKFRDLGLNGQQAFGLIEQAMDAGARNTDIAADALKEFSIRAQDGSVLTRRGFETIGLDADKMGKMVAAGGDSATSALRQTLNALQAMPPGVDRSTAAVDLFGTKAEDLGQALYSMDLDNAADKFDRFAGTVDDMAKKISDSTSFWDKLGRGISNAASGLGEFLDYDFSDMLDDMPELKGYLDEVNRAQKEFDATGSTEELDKLAKKYPELAGAINKYIDKKRDEKGATDDATGANQSYLETLDQMLSKLQGIADPVLSLSSAQRDYQASLDAATQSLKDNKAGLDITTEGGRANKDALDNVASSALGVADAMSKSGSSVSDVNAFLTTAHDQLVQTAIDLGMSGAEAEAYAASLGLVPRSVLTNVELRANSAMENIAAYKRALDNIPRVITTTTQVRGSNIALGSGGHYYLGQEHGGIATRPHWAAQTGGQRHSSTMINEAGPEVAELPDGTRMLTAGATRALADTGALGGGGATDITIGWSGPTSGLLYEFAKGLRLLIRNEHGGDVIAALGQG